MSARVRIAHLGAPGAFTEEAARRFAELEGLDAELAGHATSAEVLAAVSAGAAELAVLPIANTTAGLVRRSLAALAGHDLEVAGEVALAVHLALLSRCNRLIVLAVTSAVPVVATA
jgi:prephenate dehydratase